MEDLSAAVEVQLPGSETRVQYTLVMRGVTLRQDQTAPAECLRELTALECLGAVQTPPLPPPPQVIMARVMILTTLAAIAMLRLRRGRACGSMVYVGR